MADVSGEVLISNRRETRPAEELSLAARSQGVAFSPALEIDVSLSAIGFVQSGIGTAIVDALLPWQQFAGVQLRPLADSPELPVALLTSHSRTLSRAEEIFATRSAQRVLKYFERIKTRPIADRSWSKA